MIGLSEVPEIATLIPIFHESHLCTSFDVLIYTISLSKNKRKQPSSTAQSTVRLKIYESALFRVSRRNHLLGALVHASLIFALRSRFFSITSAEGVVEAPNLLMSVRGVKKAFTRRFLRDTALRMAAPFFVAPKLPVFRACFRGGTFLPWAQAPGTTGRPCVWGTAALLSFDGLGFWCFLVRKRSGTISDLALARRRSVGLAGSMDPEKLTEVDFLAIAGAIWLRRATVMDLARG